MPEHPDTNTVLFTVTYLPPDGAEYHDTLDRLGAAVVSTIGVESVRFLDDRPLDDLGRELAELLTARFQIALSDLSHDLADLVELAFKRGATSVIGLA